MHDVCVLPVQKVLHELIHNAFAVALQLLVKDVRSRMRLEDVEDHSWITANADPALLAA